MPYFPIMLLVITVAGGISIVYYSLVCKISPMPTSRKVRSLILELLNKYDSGNKVYDLGSGWGTLVLAISAESPDYDVKGIERSPVPYLCSILLNRVAGRSNSDFLLNNFFRISLREADVVVCYLCTELMGQLKTKLERELKPGALVISNTFALPEWQPVETVTVNDLYQSKVYVYRKGSRQAAGTRISTFS